MNTKRLILLFSVCFLISTYFVGFQWNKRLGLQQTQREAKSGLEKEKILEAALMQAIGGREQQTRESDLRKIDEELVSLVLALKGGLPGRMITVTSMTIARGSSAQQGTPIGLVVKMFPRTDGIKVLTVNVAGTYQNLRMFQDYVQQVKKLPVVLTGFSLNKNLFEMQIQLLGK